MEDRLEVHPAVRLMVGEGVEHQHPEGALHLDLALA